MERVRCAYCGEIVGVYEPVRLVLPDGIVLHGSRLTLGDELGASDSAVLHARCCEAFQQTRPEAEL